MTYGEAKYIAKKNYLIIYGIAILNMPPHKPRMKYEEACKYYNKKLFNYWIKWLGEQVLEEKRNDVLESLKKFKN